MEVVIIYTHTYLYTYHNINEWNPCLFSLTQTHYLMHPIRFLF